MNKIKYTLPAVALSIFLSGCGHDVEITSHSDTPDFSDYTATIIDAKSIKGTYLDPEFRREKAMRFREIMYQTSSKDFAFSDDAIAQLNKYIAELNEFEDIDVENLKSRLVAYKSDVTKVKEADKKRTDATIARILEDAKPIFAEIDKESSKKAAFDAYIKAEVESIAQLKKQNDKLLIAIEKVKQATNKSIDKFIIDSELPVRVGYYNPHIHFKNEEEYREGDTCSPNRKDKPDYRGNLITASTGEKICAYDFRYSLANMHSFSEEDGKKIHQLAKNGFEANRDNYVKLGLIENQLDMTEKSLEKKKIIGANKHGKRLRDIEYDLRSLNYRIEKLGEGLFNEDRTVNLDSTAFKRAKKYNKDVPHVTINRDMRIFTKFDNDYDDVYRYAAMQAISSLGHEVEMGSNGFDLPSGMEQQDILFMIATTDEQPEEGERVYLWDNRAFSEPGQLQLDYKIRLSPNNKSQAQDKIFSLLRS